MKFVHRIAKTKVKFVLTFAKGSCYHGGSKEEQR